MLDVSAQAGSWQFACGAGSSGQATHQVTDFFGVHPAITTKWVPPGGADQPSIPANSLTLPGLSNSPYTSSAGPNAVFTEDVNVTAVITATWTHGTGQTDANDPAPSSLWLIETSSAGWSAEGSGSGVPVPGTGSASDGLSNPADIPVISYDSNGMKNGESYNSKNAPVTTPPAHWFVQPVSGGTFTFTRTFTFTFTRTFTAHCVGKLPASATGGGIINTSCSFGGYTVTIHAQPYNFRLGPFNDPTSGKSYPTGIADDGNGQLFYNYIWDSTDGNLNDLANSVVYEHIDNTGNSTGTYSTTASGVAQYAPVNPPFNATVVATYNQPDPNGANPTSGTVGFQHDVLIRPPLLKPFFAGTFTYSSTQNWLLNDSMTVQTGVKLLGPLTITRTVTGSPTTSWVYTVSKGSSSASYTIP